MLKISSSLCRYTLRVCEQDNTTNVWKIVDLNLKRKSCGTVCAGGLAIKRHLHTGSVLKKKLKPKIASVKLNEHKSTVPMSDLPTANHVSCGGKFRISPTENKAVENWREQGSTDNRSVEDWRKWSSAEKKVVEDWRKRTPSDNRSVEDWRKVSSTIQNSPVENWRRQSSQENRSIVERKSWNSDSSSADDTENQEVHELPPDFRVWESGGDKSGGSDTNQTFEFKVMSYNVLAQYLLECHPYLYRECRPKNLKWKVRASRLFEEITTLSPDILCLQEVQVSHINSFYSKFEEIGYFGIFKQKTNSRQDGCAVYFKQSLFKMEDHVSVEFYQPELPILNRDNIGIIVKLVPCNNPNSPIIVATTHLLYNPKRTDVRLAQMQVFLAEIDRFAYYSNGDECGHFPIILTGDFNSKPESAVIKLLDNGHVRGSSFRDCSDWQKIGITDNCQHLSVYLNRQLGQNTDYSDIKIYNSEYSVSPHSGSEVTEQPSTDDYSEMFNSGEIGHSLKLISVYDKLKADGIKEASTFQDYWVTVDYIYFSCNRALRLVERLRLPSVTECEALGCLPNDVYGSDHLALAAKFELNLLKSSL